MTILNDFINYFKNMNEDKIVNILIAIIIITSFCMLSSVVSYFTIKLFMKNEKKKEKIKANAFYLPLKILIIFIGLYVAVYIMSFPKSIVTLWKKIFKIVLICLVAKGIVNIVDPKSEIAKKLRKKGASKEDRTVANFTGRILKYVVYICAAFFIATELGYNDISGLVAGLGIGGAIVALAAQDVVKSLIAGMSILSDKPFLVGDWIDVGGNEGTVIDISFRCTKLRTNRNTIITLPNTTITESSVVNWSKMKQRRYELNLKLPLEINSDTLDTVINRIRFVLQSNEKVVPDTVEIHFDIIEQTGNNINLYLYTYETEYADFLQFRQEVNMQILKILESENVKLAYPGQNIYMIGEK